MGLGYSIIGSTMWYREGSRDYGQQGYLRNSATFNPNDLKVDMSGKTVLVTGANKGIGYETAKALAGLGAEVHLLCRDAGRGKEAVEAIAKETGNADIFLHVLDCSNFRQVRDFADGFAKTNPKVDVLVHNAGAMPNTKVLTDEGKEVSMATMAGGTYLLTGLLVPLLKKAAPSRVINVSSGGMYTAKARIDDLNADTYKYDATYVYALNKRIQVILTEMWAEKLKDSGVTVNSMHPGWAATETLKESMPDFYEQQQKLLRTPAEGADTIVYLAAAEEAGKHTGKFWFDRQPVRTNFPFSGTDCNPAERERLWNNVAAYCSFDYSP